MKKSNRIKSNGKVARGAAQSKKNTRPARGKLHAAKGSTEAEDRFAGLAILGERVACITNQYGELEMIYRSIPHFYYVFEVSEYFEGGAWHDLGYWTVLHGPGKHEAFSSYIRQRPSRRVRRRFVFESGIQVDEIAEWFDSHCIYYPEGFRESLASFQWRERATREHIEREAVAAERARIAGVLTTALAA